MPEFVCPICFNEDERYIGYRNNIPYCRRCIVFKGKKARPHLITKKVKLFLRYPLSKEQEEISSKVLQSFKEHKNTLIEAVCGAGKTELIFKTVEYALNKGLQVGFCIPRRDVVLDLFPRFKEAFNNVSIQCVYGGHTSFLEADILLLTTHQLYRYEKYFDLLIIDETDAFPYQGDYVLETFFKKALRGNYVMLSATPLKNMLEEIKDTNGTYLSLFKRYHGHPLIVPKIKLALFSMRLMVLDLLRKFLKENKPVFVFCPTIHECESLFKFIKIFLKQGECVHSKKEQRSEIIDKFKEGVYKFLVTTSILERGVTIKHLQVIVYNASDDIYTKEGLIQISGRVGRKIDAFDGEVYYVGKEISQAMEESIKKIEYCNEGIL